MIGDTFVIDAVAHPFNMSPENRAIELTGNPLPSYLADERYTLTGEEQLTDFPAYATAHALFAESQADMAVLHALPTFPHTVGPFTDLRKVAAMRDRWPARFLLYGTVDTMDADEAIRSLERQVEELHIDGLKLYPAIKYQGAMRGWKMDDREFAVPLLEAARDLGIRNVAVHKIIPVGTGMEYFRVGDFEAPLAQFPEINFHVVHAGYSFLEEFRLLFEWFPNLYANLENTVAFAVMRPRVFAEILGEMLYWGSAERICSGSGVNLMHPRPLIEAVRDFVMPEDLIEGRGYPPVTEAMKALMLGGNLARVHGIDPVAARARIGEDEFEVARRDGLREPWSGLREPAEAAVA
jgi:predicted TIM-barrel fold metal-dependent hydrolase